MKAVRYLSVLGCLLAAQSAGAITIDYDLVSLGSNSYRYEYRVTNDGSLGASVPVELFDILFDTSLYVDASLAIVSTDPPASNWDEQILGTGLVIEPAYDAFALAGGIADGTSVAGFAVQFDWLGAGAPGSQPFEIYDPNTFDLVETGTTRSAAVPEPSVLSLMMVSAVAVGLSRRRKLRLSSTHRISG